MMRDELPKRSGSTQCPPWGRDRLAPERSVAVNQSAEHARPLRATNCRTGSATGTENGC
jgi:hypothetical protein